MHQFTYRMNTPELRSVELLKSVADSAGVDIFHLTQTEINLRFQGESKRWYQIESQCIFDDEYPEETMEWVTNTKAARWKSDIINDSEFCVRLCVHPNDQKLPIGDQIVSITLALINDIQTAMEIPMLAKFLICTRSMLENIIIFQDMMVVTQDMIDDGNWPEEEMMYHLEDDIVMNEMADHDTQHLLPHHWLDEIDFVEENEDYPELRIEEKEKSDQQIISHWEQMVDDLHDKES